MSTALITGGSGGIGLELAKIMAENGHNLVLASRKQEHLDEAKKQIEDQHKVKVHTIVSDLSAAGSAEALYKAAKKYKVDILVNNAGFGYVADFFESDLAHNLAMMQLNMTSLVELSHMFGADFAKNKHGRILNIASIASFFPGPNQPVYYATKAFVRSFSRALSEKYKGSGVSVTVLHPGLTKTNFFNAAEASHVTNGADPAVVAQDGYNALMAGKAEVTSGFSNKVISNLMPRITPNSVQAAIIARSSDV